MWQTWQIDDIAVSHLTAYWADLTVRYLLCDSNDAEHGLKIDYIRKEYNIWVFVSEQEQSQRRWFQVQRPIYFLL